MRVYEGVFSVNCPLELHIKPYGDVLITYAGDVLKTSVGDIPWRYMKDNMATFSGRYIRTSSGYHISTVLRT